MISLAALLIGLAPALSEAASPAAPSPSAPACTALVREHADEGSGHVATCSPLRFFTNPPSSGDHYAYWAAYKTYGNPVPAGFLVHSLEHGAVVVGYHCPEGCPDEVARVQAWIRGLGEDSICLGMPPKVILAPNPELDVRWAAAAWGWTWKASCPDTASLDAFFRARYGKTLEAGVCDQGVDFSAQGWCPTALRPPEGDGAGGRPGTAEAERSILWRGVLRGGERLVLEAALPDGAVVETRDLEGQGPGTAEAAWDPAGFRRRHPGSGAVVLRVRTSAGRVLAQRLDLP